METITLYRVIGDGKTTVTPTQPETYDSTLYRLVAADGGKADQRGFVVGKGIALGQIDVQQHVLRTALIIFGVAHRIVVDRKSVV